MARFNFLSPFSMRSSGISRMVRKGIGHPAIRILNKLQSAAASILAAYSL